MVTSGEFGPLSSVVFASGRFEGCGAGAKTCGSPDHPRGDLGSRPYLAGLVVPGATVTVTNDDTKTTQNTVSDVEGFYRVAALEPGRYTVKVELQSFATVEAKDIVVPPSTEVRVPVELKVGSVTETVSVNASALAVSLNKTSPTIGVTIGAKQVVDLPLAGGRNVNNLILTAPNVSMAGFTVNAGQGTYIVNGQRSRNNNYLIDGSDNNDISVTVSTSSVVPESQAEFRC